MSVYKKTTASGKVSWYAIFYYRDWNGQRKQKKKEGFATQREAKAYERDFIERRSGTPKMTFAALVDNFLTDYKQRHRITSYENRRFALDRYILPSFQHIPIDEITPSMVRQWQGEMINTGQYAESSLRSIHAVLSTVLNFAVKYYGLPNNPARLAGAMGKDKPPAMDFWTLAEFKRFQQAVEGHEPYYTIYTLLFYTGIRKGELLALTLGDFDFTENTLTISKSYRRLKGGVDVIQPPKTEKGNRVIAVPRYVLDIVQRFAASIPGLTPKHRLFECTSVPSLKYNLDKFADIARVHRIRVHDLRHSHASLLIEQGFSPLVIKERLGHEDIQTTLNTYAHLYPSKQEEIAAKLEKLAAG